MYKAIDVARYVVQWCIDNNHPINNVQLQKVLYHIQNVYAEASMSAFEDDIEWRIFGPVIPDVYYDYCGSGALPIDIAGECGYINEEDTVIFDLILEQYFKTFKD